MQADEVVVRSGAREVRFPAAARRTIERVLTDEPVALNDIADDLDADSRATVVATLIREGMLINLGNRNQEATR